MVTVLAVLVSGFILIAGCKDKASEAVAPTPATTAADTTAATNLPPPSPAEIKEMQARDAFAGNVAKELHLRVPAFKNVKIYADNWAGQKTPTKTPQTDPKTRKGDNLMLVFSSPDSGTAKGLADFTKSKSAQEAADAGFAELQFVDPDTYCYAQIAPVSGVGAVKCGPR